MLDKALAVEPKNRHADAGELLEALLAAAGLAPAAAMRRGASSPTPAQPAESASASTVDYAARARLGAPIRRPPPPRRHRAAPPAEPAPGAAPAREGPPGHGRSPVQPARDAALAGPRHRDVARRPRRGTAADPMSETPFFDRHQLPPSVPAAKLDQGAPPAPQARALWPIVAVAVLGMGGAAAALFGTDDNRPTPAPTASTSASTSRPPPAGATPGRPPRPPRDPAGPAPAARAAEPGASPADIIRSRPARSRWARARASARSPRIAFHELRQLWPCE